MQQELSANSWIIIDHQSTRALWEKLLPAVQFVDAAQLDQSQVALSCPANMPEDVWQNPSAIIIDADLGYLADGDQKARSGMDWAMRLRQEPERFVCPIILLSFLPAPIVSDDDRPIVQDFLSQRWQARWVRLPMAQQDLMESVVAARSAFDKEDDKPVKLRALGQFLCKELLDQLNREYRHSQGTFCAAVRLLLGALQDGFITPDRGKPILAEIETERAGACGAAGRPYDFGLLKRYIAFTAVTTECPPNHDGAARRRLLVIDDEWETAGWKSVTPALFPEWDVKGHCSYDEVEPGKLPTFHLVLLDFMMPETSGLVVLSRIRNEQPLLPVILFTGDDNAATYTSATRYGANGFVLKELADRGDRDSLSYFRYFRQAVHELSPIDSDLLSSFMAGWSHVACRVAAANTASVCVQRLAEAVNAVRRAYFYAAYAAGLVGVAGDKPDEQHRGLASPAWIDLGKALEALCIVHDEALHEQNFFVAPEIRRLFNLGIWQGGAGITKNKLCRIADRARDARHWAYNDVRKLDTSTLVRDCGLVAETVRSCLDRWNPPLDSKPVMSPEVAQHVADSKNRFHRDSHQLRSRYGSVRFFLGYCLLKDIIPEEDKRTFLMRKQEFEVREIVDLYNVPPLYPPQGTKNVLLIDDTAHLDGWLTAFKHSVDWANFLHIANPYLMSNDSISLLARAADCLLLDLRLPSADGESPSERNGQELFKRLRAAAPSCPIVIFSSDNEVLWARRCYAAGAQYYFAKTDTVLSSGVDQDSERFFIDYYSELTQAIQIPHAEHIVDGLEEAAGFLARPTRFAILDVLSDSQATVRRLVGCEPDQPISDALSKLLGRELDVVAKLEWVSRDPCSQAAWTYITGSPSGRRYEMLLRMTASVETLIRIILAISNPSSAVGLLKAMKLDELIKSIEQGFSFHRLNVGDLVDALNATKKYRNTLLHHNPRDDLSDTRDHSAQLSAALNAMTMLAEEVQYQALESLDSAPVASDDVERVSLRLAEGLAARLAITKRQRQLERAEGELNSEFWKLANDLNEGKARLTGLLADKRRVLEQQADTKRRLGCEEATIADLEVKLIGQATLHERFSKLTRELIHEHRLKVSDIEQETEQCARKLREVDQHIHEVELRSAKTFQDCHEHLGKLLVATAALRAQGGRLRVLQEWLQGRHFNEALADKQGRPIGASGWDALTDQLDRLVDAEMISAQGDMASVEQALCGEFEQWVMQDSSGAVLNL